VDQDRSGKLPPGVVLAANAKNVDTIERVNRVIPMMDALSRETEQLQGNIVKGTIANIKGAFGTGPSKHMMELVTQIAQDLGPIQTGSVRTVSSQFERQIAAAPTLKDQLDVTRAYIATMLASVRNSRREAAGMGQDQMEKIPTYMETQQSTIKYGNKELKY
jgi:hypothetical protein